MDLSQRDVEESMVSRDAIRQLLDRASAISRPADGAPRVLLVFAMMAGGACDWLDGELRVELVEADDVTVIECMTDLGGGFRERVFAPIVMRAPIEEFRRATTVPEMISPLVVKSSRGRRLVLVAEPQAEAPSMMAPAVEIGKDNLFNPPTGGGLRAVPAERSRSSTGMRAVRAIDVPAPAPIPHFTITEGEEDAFDDGSPPPPTQRNVAPPTASLDEEAVVSSRTMIPSGLGAPPPPPIVHAMAQGKAKARDPLKTGPRDIRREVKRDPRRESSHPPDAPPQPEPARAPVQPRRK